MALTVPAQTYVTAADALVYVPNVEVTATGAKPTLTQFEAMLTLVFEEVNSLIEGKGLATPLTDATAILRVRNGQIFGALEMMYLGKNDDAQAAPWAKKYRDFKKDLVDEKIHLGIAIPDSNPRISSDFATGGDREDSIFTMDDEY